VISREEAGPTFQVLQRCQHPPSCFLR
jgi:hypothetical protein